MGDGRYFTYRQFFEISFLVIMLTMLTFMILYLYLKSRTKDKIPYLILSSALLFIATFVSFIKEVAYTLEAVKILNYINLMCVLISIFVLVLSYTQHKKGYSIVFVIGCLISRFDFIKSFDFVNTEVSLQYITFTIILSGLLFIHLSKDILGRFKSFRRQESLNGTSYYHFLESFFMGIGISSFLLGHLLEVYLSQHIPFQHIPFQHIGLFLAVCMFILTFLKFMPEETIPIGYHSLIENMTDTIIALDISGKVLYKNDTPFRRHITEALVIDLGRLENIFIGNAILMDTVGPDSYKVNFNDQKGERISCRLSLKKIYQKERCLGKLLVFEDYTYLESMIVQLERQKKELESIKKELVKYSRTSQVLSAEKERSRLLLEVQNELGHHLAELSKYITKIIKQIDDEKTYRNLSKEQMEDSIRQGINMARNNLEKIRETVRMYRMSYEQKGV